MSQSRTLCVGGAGHQEAIAVASGAQDPPAEVVYLGPIGTRQDDIDQRIRRLLSKSPPRGWVYEAGPCGSWR
jgi:hypothetical protein